MDLRPYLELMRLGNPAGSLLVYFPHLFGSLLARKTQLSDEERRYLLYTNVVFLLSSTILHAAGCSWNDIIDAEIDKKVTRTRERPMARGAISFRNAYILTATETFLWLTLLALVSNKAVMWSLPLIPATVFYPYAKRYTNFPSIVLGPIISWGAFVGYSVISDVPLGSDFIVGLRHCPHLFSLFAACTTQVVLLDMIYAHQDLTDDLKLGVGSMAVHFRGKPKRGLAILACCQMLFLILTGLIGGLGFFYSSIACGGIALVNAWMIFTVDLTAPAECWWWFQAGTMVCGPVLAVGLYAKVGP